MKKGKSFSNLLTIIKFGLFLNQRLKHKKMTFLKYMKFRDKLIWDDACTWLYVFFKNCFSFLIKGYTCKIFNQHLSRQNDFKMAWFVQSTLHSVTSTRWKALTLLNVRKYINYTYIKRYRTFQIYKWGIRSPSSWQD